METIGDRIKFKRKELGLTQVELGEKLNVTDRAVSKWEQNDGNPDIAFLPKLAQIFNVSIDYLLTGSEPQKEIIIKSPKEMLFETDDVQYLDKISANELNIIEIYKHKLVNTFGYLVDNSKIRSYLRGRSSRYNDCNDYLPEIVFMLLISNRLDKMKLFGFNDIGFAEEKEFTDEMIDEIVSGVRVNDETRNYILTIHCRQLISINQGDARNTETYHRYGNWQLIYPRLLDKFALAKKWDWVKKILDIAFAIDKPNAEIYDRRKKEPHSYYEDNRAILSFTPPRENYGLLQVIAIRYSTLQTLLKEKQYELLNYANSINEMLDKDVITQKVIDSALIDSDNALTEEDKFLKHAVYKEIINCNLLESCDDLKLVRKILDENYYNYFEMVCDLLTSNRIKDLFEFFVDNGYDEIAQLLLYGTDRDKKEVLERSFTELIVVPARTDRPEYKAHKSLLENQNRISMENIESYLKARVIEENISKNRFLSGRNLIDEYLQLDNNWVVDYIKGLKEKIYQRIVDRQELEKQKKKEAAEREKLAKGLTKDYFANLLDSGKPESIKLFKLELCSLLDAIFLYDYHYAGEDFSERMNEHFKQIEQKLPRERDMDDGWGYSVPDTQYNNDVVKPAKEHAAHLRDIFYRLRVLRNNILHPEKISVQDLTEDEMKECLEYVFSINKKVEE